MSGAVVVRQNRLIERFRAARALDSPSARLLAEVGCRDSWVFRRMVAKGVFVEAAEGRYYLDERGAQRFVRTRRRAMIMFLVAVALLFGLWWILAQLFAWL
jgi:hypothetical protein